MQINNIEYNLGILIEQSRTTSFCPVFLPIQSLLIANERFKDQPEALLRFALLVSSTPQKSSFSPSRHQLL